MDEFNLEGTIDGVVPPSMVADSNYWTIFAEKMTPASLSSVARSQLWEEPPQQQPSLDASPPTFLVAARGAYEVWCRSRDILSDEDMKNVFQLFVLLESPYSRVRGSSEHAIPTGDVVDGDPMPFFLRITDAAIVSPVFLHLFLLQHVHSRGYNGRLQGPVAQGCRQMFFESIVKACANLPTMRDILQSPNSTTQEGQLLLESTGGDVHSEISRKLDEACSNYSNRPLHWRVSMASCGIVAFSLLSSVDNVLQSTSGNWIRSFLSSERALCDAVHRASSCGGDRELKESLLLLVADAIHVLALVHDPRNPLVATPGTQRTPSLGQSPLHVVLQAIADDPCFVRTSHENLGSFFPYSQVLSVLTTVVQSDGRLRLSLCGAMLDLQRQSPAVGDGLILRIVQHLMGSRSNHNSLPIHRHMMMMMDDRRGNAQIQQHVMEEGLIHTFATTLLFNLDKGRQILDRANSELARICNAASGKSYGYPKLQGHLANLLYPIESIVVMVLDMCRSVVVVSQHHSTNPVTFLLSPVGSYPHPLGVALLDFLRDFACVCPAVAVSSICFLAACIHHNVRDVVPALQERGALDMLLGWIHPNTAHKIRPIVRLATAQVFQAFYVHQESREAIRSRSSHLSTIFDGLVECVDYPASRIALSPEAAMARDWPQKIPHDLLATCGKDFFAIARELPKEDSNALFSELCGLFLQVSPNLTSVPSWKLREAMEQLTDFIVAAVPSPNGGRLERDFWPRRREDAEVPTAPEMASLRAAGLGSHLHSIVDNMVAISLAAHTDSPETQPSQPNNESAQTAAEILSFDVLAPLLTRVDPSDFNIAFAPIMKVTSDIASAARLSRRVSNQDAGVLSSVLQFITQLPEGRRCPSHVNNAKERILSSLNDVYCVCMENFQRPSQHLQGGLSSVGHGPGSLSQLPSAPKSIAALMISMQKLFASGAHQSPALHPLGGLGGRMRGIPSRDSLDGPTFNSVERALEALEHQGSKWSVERDPEGVYQTLVTVVVQLQATMSMLTPAAPSRSMPAPLMVSTRLTELVRLFRGIIGLLPCISEAKERDGKTQAAAHDGNNDGSAPAAIKRESAASHHSRSLDTCVADAVDLTLSIAKLAVTGHRLASRDTERRRDVSQLVTLFFEHLTGPQYVTKRILTTVLQLLGSVCRGALFSSPPTADNVFAHNQAHQVSPPLRPLDSPNYRLFSPAMIMPSFMESDLDARDSATEKLRVNALRWLTYAVGPLYTHCDTVESISKRQQLQQHEIVPGHQGVSGSAIDLDFRRAASQILFAAFGSPHYRENAIDIVGRCLKRDFEVYCPLLHLFAVCIAQKGNLNLRKAISSMTSFPTFLLDQLQMALDVVRTNQQKMHAADENAGADDEQITLGEAPAAVARDTPTSSVLRRALLRMEFILSLFNALQLPPSPNTRQHQIVERVCEHYQNGFCWHGPECSNAHSDAVMHMRSTLESSDQKFMERLRAVFPATDLPKSLPLSSPAFVGGLGVSILRPCDASALLSVIAGCLPVLSAEQAQPKTSTFAAVPLLFPVRDHASVVFQACVRVAALQLQLDDDRSKISLQSVPLEVFASFDRELPNSHRALVAQLVRYSIEDSFASDSLMHRCLIRVAEEQVAEDKGRNSMVQILSPEQEALVEAAAEQRWSSEASGGQCAAPWCTAATTMFTATCSAPPETPGGFHPVSPPPACSAAAAAPNEATTNEGAPKKRIQSFLFPLSEILLDLSSSGSKFVVASSRVIASYCVPASVPQDRPGRSGGSRGYVWIAPLMPRPSSVVSHARQYRGIAKHFIREVMRLHDRKSISMDFAVAVLSECASLPHVQLAAFSRPKSHPHDHGEEPASNKLQRTMLLQLMGQFQSPKMAPFFWSVTMRHPRMAVNEWVRCIYDEIQSAKRCSHKPSICDAASAQGSEEEGGSGFGSTPNDQLQGQQRWSLDGILCGIETILRHNPHSRERLTKELSCPGAIKALRFLIEGCDERHITLQRASGFALLFICSLLKVVPGTMGHEPHDLLPPPVVQDDSMVEPCATGAASSIMFEDAFDQLVGGGDGGDSAAAGGPHVENDEDDEEDAQLHVVDGHARVIAGAIPDFFNDEEDVQPAVENEPESDEENADHHDDDDDDDDDDDESDGVVDDDINGADGAVDPLMVEGFVQNVNRGAMGSLHSVFSAEPDPLDEDEEEFRIIGHDGEHIELRLAPGGGRHSLVIRGGTGFDHDPDLVRELLFRAHMSDFGGIPDRVGGGGLQRFLRRHEQRAAPPSPAVNPEEAAALFWHNATGTGRVVVLPNHAIPARASPSPDVSLATQPLGHDINPDDLIMHLFGAARTPSAQAVQQNSVASSALRTHFTGEGSLSDSMRLDSPFLLGASGARRGDADVTPLPALQGVGRPGGASPQIESPTSAPPLPPLPPLSLQSSTRHRDPLSIEEPPTPSEPPAPDSAISSNPGGEETIIVGIAGGRVDQALTNSDATPERSGAAPPREEAEAPSPVAATTVAAPEEQPWAGALDPQFLAELPSDVRQDIMLQHFPILTVPQAHAIDGQTTHVHPLFLAALPSEIQQEILALESRLGISAHHTEAQQPTASPAAVPAVQESETIMLLTIVTEPEIRRDILMTCDLSELAGNAELHAEAVRLRAEHDQQAARQVQQAREEMARQEAQARMLDAQRRAAALHHPQHHQMRRLGREDDDVFLLRARERAAQRLVRHELPPADWSSLKSSPLTPSTAVLLCRFLDASSSTAAALIARILAASLEGASYDDIHAALHLLLDFATKPLTAATAEQLRRTSRDPDAGRGGVSGRSAASKTNLRLREGDLPPASFVSRILGIVSSLVQRSRSVALSLLLLPSDHEPLSSDGMAPHATLPDDVKESEDGAVYSSFVFRPLTDRERVLLKDLPFSRLLKLLETRSDTPEVSDAVDTILSSLVQVMNAMESEAGNVPADRLEARIPQPTATAGAPVVHHPRHVHPIQWGDTLADPRYQARPYQCNLCRITQHFWAYRCASCHFDLCPGCAMDSVNATTQKARISRWGYWVVAATPLLSECASILSNNLCKERTAVRLVCLLSRGIRLCSHSSAPSDEALFELEAILCKHAKDLMSGIRNAVRRIEDTQVALRQLSACTPTTTDTSSSSPSNQQLALMDATALGRRKDSLISKALMMMELPEEMMRNVYLLFLPYAETQRSQLRPEIRLMFHASRVYLTEISNLLSQHPNRLRAVLPAAAFPLLNGYAQFHLLYGAGDATESMSMAERSETERLLSEKQTEISAVSDAAWNAVQARRAASDANNRGRNANRGDRPAAEPAVEPLPHHIYKFCEGNRTLINTLIHWDPSLLDEGLKFITRAPRLVDLDFKLKNFRKSFTRNRHRTQQHSITINRLNCFQDSFKAIKDLNEPAPIHVRFQGEEGSDAGGLVREWFQILGEEMVNDNYALFVHSSEGMTYQPNPCSGINANHLEYYRFCGMVVGLAVYNDISMDVHFTRSVYRHMIGAEPCFRDVETMDPTMFSNLEKLLSMDITPEMDLDFTVTYERFGKTEEVELIPNGSTTLLTNENKKEYIRLRSAFLMTHQIEAQLQEFLTGFYKMVPRSDIQTFTEQELELVISGLPDIDVEDLRLHTEYNGYNASSPLIRWFWEIVSSMTRQDRANLLQFATGSSKVPLGGFANLESGGHRHRFSITKTESPIELLPSAHTCFNRIDVPDYPTADMLREKLMIAITYGNKGFTMV